MPYMVLVNRPYRLLSVRFNGFTALESTVKRNPCQLVHVSVFHDSVISLHAIFDNFCCIIVGGILYTC